MRIILSTCGFSMAFGWFAAARFGLPEPVPDVARSTWTGPSVPTRSVNRPDSRAISCLRIGLGSASLSTSRVNAVNVLTSDTR
jgi:hypothetical protein